MLGFAATFAVGGVAIAANPPGANSTGAAISRANASAIRAADPHGALKDAKRMVQESPGDIAVYHARAKANLVLGKKQEAIADYKKAIALETNSAASYCGLAAISIINKDLDGAQQQVLQALKLDANAEIVQATVDDFIKERLKQSMREANARNYAGAVNQANLAIELSPKNGNLYGFRASMRIMTGDWNGALQDRLTAEKLFAEKEGRR